MMMFHFSDPLGKIPNVADMESKDLNSVIEIESVVSKITGRDFYKDYYPSPKFSLTNLPYSACLAPISTAKTIFMFFFNFLSSKET